MRHKRAVSSLLAIGALLAFYAGPALAQDQVVIASDFETEVAQATRELTADPQAQKAQAEVLDSEDEHAGDQNNQDIDVEDDISQSAVDAGNADLISSSEVDEVKDADDLDVQSQAVIDEQSQASIDEQQQDGVDVEQKPDDSADQGDQAEYQSGSKEQSGSTDQPGSDDQQAAPPDSAPASE